MSWNAGHTVCMDPFMLFHCRNLTAGRDLALARRAMHLVVLYSLPKLTHVAFVIALASCSLVPAGTGEEQSSLERAGGSFEVLSEDRVLPELPANPTWHDILQRAFLANGDLEKAYFEWKAALERIEIASGYPNTNLSLGYTYTCSSDHMKTFDRMMFTSGFDTMENLSYPGKVMRAGKLALDETRSAGERFRAAKFDLQRRVLLAWADYALTAEKVRIAREQLWLSTLIFETATGRVRAGGPQQDLLKAEVAERMAENTLKGAEAELVAMRATLNALLARKPDAALEPPHSLPEPRPVPCDDASLIAIGVEENPELASLAWQVRGRTDALELARLQWIPDVNPLLVFTGGIAQAVGAAIVLPTTVAEIRGKIREARADLRSSEAALQQAGRERAASFVATLVSLRNAEREALLVEGSVLPASQKVLSTVEEAYISGRASYLDLIDSQRTLLEVRLAIAEARTQREKRLAELEALAGTDIESFIHVPAETPHTVEENAPEAKSLDAREKEKDQHD